MVAWFSRGAGRIEDAAEHQVRRRLAERASVEVQQLLEQGSVPPALLSAATSLVEQFAKILGVEAGQLRATDRLEDLLRVEAHELPSINSRDWKRAQLDKTIVVHAYDIMHLVETSSDRSKWKQKWSSLPTPPQSEEQWIKTILSMDIAEFLLFFAPLRKA